MWQTWRVRKENDVAVWSAEMRMKGWMCDMKVTDRVPSKQIGERD